METISNVINKDGVNFNIKLDTQTVLYISLGVFFGVVLGGVMIKILTKNL